MATKKPRFNVTVEPKEEKILSILAKKEDKSISFLIRELILEALERREDAVLSAIADERLQEPQETISHKDIWKKLIKKAS